MTKLITSAVATGNPQAADAAHLILKQGGSAIDAAIAADAVMGLVEPMATSIGGDLLALIHEPGQSVQGYNGSGRAPIGLSTDLIAALPDGRIPQRHPLSVTTPGAVRGWWDLHQKYGKLPWQSLFDHAISLANNGFKLGAVAAYEWRIFDHVLYQDHECARLFMAGNTPAAGTILTNPGLANALQLISDNGHEAFYKGPIAKQIVSATTSHNGVLSASDLERHVGECTTPISTEFSGYRVYECPPNTQGLAVLEALNEIEKLTTTQDDPLSWIHIIEASRDALAKARDVVADPSGNTVCTCVTDNQGLSVTFMSSIFKRFGSGIAVPGYGFCLQNRGFGFSEIGHINGPAPNKRPYHTVIPCIVTDEKNNFFAALGVVGGLMQPQGQIQILTRVLKWGTHLQKALDAPRLRLESDKELAIEEGWPDSIKQALRESGFDVPHPKMGELAGRSDFGGCHAIMRAENGALIGAADPRKDGRWLSNSD